MQKNHTRGFLAIGIIVLFVGVGIHPAFAVDNRIPSFENEKPNPKSGEIYENTNCFVMGVVGNAKNGFHIFGKGYIIFGLKFAGKYQYCGGWIYTDGDNGTWRYNSIFKGGFLGNIRSIKAKDWWFGIYFYYYVGIENFRGFALGGHPIIGVNEEPVGAPCLFVGRADHVKIISG